MIRKKFKHHKWSLARIRGCQYVRTCERNGCGAWAIAVRRGVWTILDKNYGLSCEGFPTSRR